MMGLAARAEQPAATDHGIRLQLTHRVVLQRASLLQATAPKTEPTLLRY
jgi:hypothetical protein